MSSFRKVNSSASFTVSLDDTSVSQKSSSSVSLQESFNIYRNNKLDEIRQKINEANKNLRKSFRSNPDRMMKLRLKFVEQAKKYFNVPYAKKYFSPDSPEYQSKLFLDCCGLVRRVMRDLEYEFGFRIGGGNQAYMFDTLPKTIEKLEDVKPGDLVFVQAVYYNPKMKKQAHNITHVEIMLGEGEKTIGARWNNGKVQVFDSYKFVSKSYHSQVYYIKSIDTWLMGLCRSYCSKHTWNYNTVLRNKKSIFYLNQEKKFKKSTSVNSNLNKPKKKKKKKKNKKKKQTKSVVSKSDQNDVQPAENKNKIELLNEHLLNDENKSEDSDSDQDDSQNENENYYDNVDDDYNQAENVIENANEEDEQDEPAEQEDPTPTYHDDFYVNKAENSSTELRPFTSIDRSFNMLNIKY